MSDVVIRKSRLGGLGVFATRPFKKGELVFSNYVLCMPLRMWQKVSEFEGSDVYGRVYEWGVKTEQIAIACGEASFINHSFTPNVRKVNYNGRKVLSFYALRNIANNEEVAFNYLIEGNDADELWFKPTPHKPAKARPVKKAKPGSKPRSKKRTA